uniref:Uncharacterized protein n=1 Tax=Ralstonia solanacearum TaxID=305 RepID=A0A0S4TTZ8_RALSL|nr:protein of unknown function [Ralstonia solanacearum]
MSTVRARNILWPARSERSDARSMDADTEVVAKYSCQRAALAGADAHAVPRPAPHTKIHCHTLRFTTITLPARFPSPRRTPWPEYIVTIGLRPPVRPPDR